MASIDTAARTAADTTATVRLELFEPAMCCSTGVCGPSLDQQLIDVRETEEFSSAHAAGAKHLSRGVIELKIEEAAPDLAAPIVCYCGGGSRSALVAESLQRMGYSNVASLAGGFKAWKDAGLPVE